MKYLINLSDVAFNQKIFIYGAGVYGVRFYNELKKHRPDIVVVSFIDKHKTGSIKSIGILSLEQASIQYRDMRVIVCTEETYWEEIYDDLKKMFASS